MTSSRSTPILGEGEGRAMPDGPGCQPTASAPSGLRGVVTHSAGFTPGPWRIRENARNDQDTCDLTICGDIFCLADINGPQYEHCYPNARLIAAAPALYEALEAALDGLRRASRQLTEEHKFVLNGRAWGGLLIDNAEAALAQARGEQ